MPKLILCRHGETVYNAQKRYQGKVDIELNERGLAQAEALRERIAPIRLDGVYCSDLKRTVRTAEIVLSTHSSGLTAQPTPLLREIDGGEFEGLTWDEITARFPQEVAAWQQDRTNNPAPGGENLLQVQKRLDTILAQILETYPAEDQTVLLVVHGGVISTLLCHMMGMNLNRLWQWRVDNCSVTIVDTYKDGPILSLFNDLSHFKGQTVY